MIKMESIQYIENLFQTKILRQPMKNDLQPMIN